MLLNVGEQAENIDIMAITQKRLIVFFIPILLVLQISSVLYVV